MAERRALVEGLRSNPSVEREFVYGGSNDDASPTPVVKTQKLRRVQICLKVREDYANGLKKASLQRRLDGIEPNLLQELLEEALGAWLSANKIL